MANLKPRDTAPVKKAAKDKPIKLPKTVAACGDRLFQCRAERAEAQKVVDALEREEKALKEHLILTLPKGEASGTAGKLAKVFVYTREIPQVKDWDAFWGFVVKHKRFDLVQRRISEGAVQDLREDLAAKKRKLPGVEPFNVVSVSCTKL